VSRPPGEGGHGSAGTPATTGLQEIYAPQLRKLHAADWIPRPPADRRLRNRNRIMAVCPAHPDLRIMIRGAKAAQKLPATPPSARSATSYSTCAVQCNLSPQARRKLQHIAPLCSAQGVHRDAVTFAVTAPADPDRPACQLDYLARVLVFRYGR